MRSKFLHCAAIAAVGLSSWLAPMAHAAGAKDKDPKKKPAELHADEKSMKKQTQWEDKIMGPDTKRAELEKIARARAVNEKAEKDKERQAALEAAAPPAPSKAAAPGKKNDKSEVNLLSDSADTGGKAEPSRGISPKLETEAAREAPKPVKHADDKFIDKLLRDEDAPKKHASAADDKELENLLAGAKEKPHKKGDSIDDLLKAGDKAPAMPAPRVQSGGLPEWAKQPEISSPPPPIAVRAVPKKKDDSGVIHVVQGAAGNAPAVVSTPPAPAPVAARSGRGKAGKAGGAAAAQQVVWSDPFAEKKPGNSSPKKEPASRPSAPSTSEGGAWSDPFAEPAESRKAGRKGASAPTPASAPKRRDAEKADPGTRPATWKDPFTKATVPVPPRAPVAMREPAKGESSKWEIAARRPAARTPSADAHAAGGWGVLKKRAH
jgi:hypothetical protein